MIVDDDAEIRSLTAKIFGRDGHRVIPCADAAAMKLSLQRVRPDIVLLDRMMPGVDGEQACRELRDEGDDVPVIMLTALGETNARIEGLSAGADDYVVKPFDPRELLLRIEAVLRRRLPSQALPDPTLAPIKFGRCELNSATRTLQVEDVTTLLTDAEYCLLRGLLANAGRAMSRLRLGELMHGSASIQDRSIDVAVHRLRRLVEINPERPLVIQTVRGLGYVLVV